MKHQTFVTLVALGLVATACGAGSSASNQANPPTVQATEIFAANVDMVRPAANVDYRAMAAGNRQLGYALAQRLDSHAPDGNLVFSPASLAFVFAMLRDGALGPTAAAIDDVIHLPANRRAAYDGLVTALGDLGVGNSLDLTNAMFVAPGDRRLAVHQVVQQATITVGEKGTVAAAATGAVLHVVSPQRLVGPVLDADHPFAFAVMDNTTGSPLFEGTVSDPS